MNKRKDKRELITKIAKTFFQRYGYGKTSLDDIAREAFIGKGTIYYYFESKEEIFFHIAEIQLEKMDAKLELIFDDTDNYEEFLKNIIMRPLELIADIDSVVFDVKNTLRSTHAKKLEEIEQRFEDTICGKFKRAINIGIDRDIIAKDTDVQHLSVAILEVLYSIDHAQGKCSADIKQEVQLIIPYIRTVVDYLVKGILCK